MLAPEHREDLVRKYACGELSLRDLRDKGLVRYTEVLATLADLGLQPPLAAMTGPNVASREAGIKRLHAVLSGR